MNVAVLFKGAATLLWLVVIGLIALAVTRASRGKKVGATSTTIIVLAVVAVLLTSVAAGLVFIEPNERGVVISAVQQQGYRSEALTPGLRWIVPFLERVQIYEISGQTYTMATISNDSQSKDDDAITARTLDGQEIFIDASVIFQIDPNKVPQVHIVWQNRYENDLIRPQTRGAIRDAVSQYGVEEVLSTKRGEMVDRVRGALEQKLSANGLILVDFILRNITFSPEYAASVEQKQIAEQQAQQAQLVVEQRRQEAEQARQVAQGQADAVVINSRGKADARLIEAEAEAKSLDLLNAAIQDNPDLLTYNYINKLAPGIQVMLVPSNSPYLLPLPEIGPTGTTTVTPTTP